MFLFDKVLGRWAKTKRGPEPAMGPQPIPPRPRASGALPPQRPTRPPGDELSPDFLEFARYTMEAGMYALAPLPAPLPPSPPPKDAVPFPKMESAGSEGSKRVEERRRPPQSSRPPLRSPSPAPRHASPPRSQAPSSFASPPPSTAPSPYESSKLTSRFSLPSSILSATSDSCPPPQEIGVSPQQGQQQQRAQPQIPRRPAERYWTVVQCNNIRVPSVRETRWLTAGVLGCGGFARVYHVYSVAAQQPCAMKVVRFQHGLPESACAGLVNELKVLAFLGEERERGRGSPFVLQPFVPVGGRWAWRSTRGSLHILTEVCGGGTLAAYRFRLSYPSLVLVIAEIVRRLAAAVSSAVICLLISVGFVGPRTALAARARDRAPRSEAEQRDGQRERPLCHWRLRRSAVPGQAREAVARQ